MMENSCSSCRCWGREHAVNNWAYCSFKRKTMIASDLCTQWSKDRRVSVEYGKDRQMDEDDIDKLFIDTCIEKCRECTPTQELIDDMGEQEAYDAVRTECLEQVYELGVAGKFDAPHKASTAPSDWDKQVGGDHYTKDGRIQPFEVAMKNNYNALQHAIQKYVDRYREKGDPIENLEKAKNCLGMLIEWEIKLKEEREKNNVSKG